MIPGERLYLRAWEQSDVAAFYRWFNDPEVSLYLGNAYPAWSLEQEQRIYDQPREHAQRYAIVLKEGDVLIGNCDLHGIDQKNRSADVGIVIGDQRYWNQGYGREALGLLLEIGFDGLGLERIALLHLDLNERGHRCYLAAGFKVEGRLRHANYIRGAYHDDILMSILADEYRARQRPHSAGGAPHVG
ncbi:MAG: GNAT family N-acetyltransferase [Chloroflexi bacterium]|nr:GNAT family N-acetyltransferase [Chloroflexota bacterium]